MTNARNGMGRLLLILLLAILHGASIHAGWYTNSTPAYEFETSTKGTDANNWLNAYPILERLKVPATLFVATAYLDSDQPFPRRVGVAHSVGLA